MENITTNLTELLILIFLAITFLQSGLDKIFDWKGNLGWLTGHFKKTLLDGMVPFLLGIITITEGLTGLLATAGFVMILSGIESAIPLYAVVLASVTLLMLFMGQRLAKDYAGAFTLTGYFLVSIFGVYLLTA